MNSKNIFRIFYRGGIDLNYISSKTRRGRVQDNGFTSPTICAENPEICRIERGKMGLRIRKLTPRETWRLMDQDDEDFEKAEKVNSQTQLYKQAGNSIVVNVLVAIFGQMFEGRENDYKKRVE